MSWRRPDGSTYRDDDRDDRFLEVKEIVRRPQPAPGRAETANKAPEPVRTPVHTPTARERLADVLDRIKSGELAAVTELPAALANARKESRS